MSQFGAASPSPVGLHLYQQTSRLAAVRWRKRLGDWIGVMVGR
jgi:hypothetical protein